MIWMWIIIFVLAVLALVKSADFFTEAAEEVGIAVRIPPFIVGVTIVGLGTSMPEFATGLLATLKGDHAFVWANILGSNIANILLILGLATLVAGVVKVERDIIKEDLPLLVGGTALTLFTIWDGSVSSFEALTLLGGLGAYLGYAVAGRNEEREVRTTVDESVKQARANLKRNLLLIVATMIGIYLGAEFTVRSATNIAEILHIPSAIVAVTAVALGTSLPELVVSIRAAQAKKFELAIGNIIGSNLMNMFFIGGIVGLLRPTVIEGVIFTLGIPVLIIATILMAFSGISKSYHRWNGAIMLLIYIAFIAKLFA